MQSSDEEHRLTSCNMASVKMELCFHFRLILRKGPGRDSQVLHDLVKAGNQHPLGDTVKQAWLALFCLFFITSVTRERPESWNVNSVLKNCNFLVHYALDFNLKTPLQNPQLAGFRLNNLFSIVDNIEQNNNLGSTTLFNSVFNNLQQLVIFTRVYLSRMNIVSFARGNIYFALTHIAP